MPRSRASRCSRLSRPCCCSSFLREHRAGDLLRHVEARQRNPAEAGSRWNSVSHGQSREPLPRNTRGLREPPAHRIPNDGPHLQAAVPFVNAFDNRPERLGGAGALDRTLRRLDERPVHAPVLPLLFRDAPARERVPFELLQALLLRVPSQMHPELQDQRAIVGQPLLERRDAREPDVERRGLAVALNPLHDRRRIPRLQEQADPAAGRKGLPVAPVLGPARAPRPTARRTRASRSTGDPSTRSGG